MSRCRSWLVVASALVLSACDDSRNPAGLAANRPAAVISDGRFVGGNDDFFFLPPMMADPRRSTNYDVGGFNPALGPSVNVCQLVEDPIANPDVLCKVEGGQTVLVADFPSSQVRVSVGGEHYSVNWHTNDSDLRVDRFYRLQVFLGATRIGYADIDPVSNARDLKNANTGEIIPLVDGRTLPVKFRIEKGVLCDNEADCGEFQVTNAGGTFVTNTGYAGIRFEEGFLPEGISAITLTIERVVVGRDNRCHGEASGALWREWEGCYEITSDPDLRPRGIQKPAIAGQCVELAITDPLYDYLQPYKSHNGGGLERLASADAPFLDCEGFEGSPIVTGFGASPVSRLAFAGLGRLGSGIQRVFGVKTLEAIDLGLGEVLGVGSGLSRFDWAIGLAMDNASGGGESAGFGLAAPKPLQLRVRSLHTHGGDGGDDTDDEGHPDAVPGVEVVFSITDGDGNFGLNPDQTPILTQRDTTDAEGWVSTPFTAASNSLTNVVEARVRTLDGVPTTFEIEGLPSDLQVGGLTRSVAEPTTEDALSWSFTVTNVGRGVAVPSVARVAITLEEEGTEPVASFDLAVPRMLPGATVTLTTPVLTGPRAAGDHSVIVMVNAMGLVIEGSDENNAQSQSFTIVEGTIDLAGAYGSLLAAGVFSRWNAFAGDIRADIGTAGSSPWADLANFNAFQLGDYNFEVNRQLWADNFAVVDRANVIIARAPRLDIGAEERDRAIAEAKFLRAIAYYNLVTLYENVPLLTSPPSPQRVVETSSPQATWAQLEQDLVDAAAVLPDIGAAGTATSRATRGAALAMLGRARLQMAGTLGLGAKWGEAAQSLGTVITSGRYSLLTDYADNFREARDNSNTETVFDVRAEDSFATREPGIGFTKLIGPCYRPSGTPGAGVPTPYNPTFCDARPTRSFFNAFFDSRTASGAVDPRLEATILYDNEALGSEPIYGRTRASYFIDDPLSVAREDTMIFFRKYGETQLPSDQRWDNPINFKVIRYADVLLMHAEALNETGQVAGATASLNQVRVRVGKAPLTALSQGQMRDAILAERMLELGLEGTRFNDLRRHGRLGPQLAQLDPDFGAEPQSGRPGFELGKSERLPIPTFVRNLYPNVRQNPGW